MRILSRLLLVALVSTSSAFAATQESVSAACLQFWKSSVTSPFTHEMQTVFSQLCDCQAKTVMAAGLDPKAVDNWTIFMNGGKLHLSNTAAITPVTKVFEAANAPCEAQIMKSNPKK